MIRRTFASISDQLSRVAGVTGLAKDDATLMGYLNEATEELLNEFDFPWCFDRLLFNVTTGKIILPSGYERIAMMSLNGVTQTMQSPWFEFVGYGLDLLSEVAGNSDDLDYLYRLSGVLDRDQICQFQDVPTDQTYYLAIYGQPLHDERTDGQRATIVVQGYDVNNQWIRTQNAQSEWIDGIEVEINGDTTPYRVITTQSISLITAVSKPVTNGYVYAYAAPAVGTPTLLAVYSPKDTEPYFREYRICGLADSVTYPYQIKARCRKKFMPVTETGDFLMCSNLPAMKAMVQSIYYRDANEPDDYLKYKTIAVDTLKKEAKSYIGLQRTKPIITVAESMGVRGGGQYIL